LAERLQPLIAAHQGNVAIAVKSLAMKEGEKADEADTFRHRADVPMPTASLIKVAVMVEAYRRSEAEKDSDRIDLKKMVTLNDRDKVPGSGILTQHFSAGTQFSVRDAMRLMMVYSDNTATNLVLDQIGIKSTGETMERLGFANTKIHAKVYRRDTSIAPARSKQFGLGSTTADEMVGLLELIYRKKAASATACEAMLDHLAACDDRTTLVAGVPKGTKVYHKSGAVDGVRTSAGIIETKRGPVAVCVLTSENKDLRWSDDNAGNVLCAKVARAVWERFAAR
jgi:beta-lactamase class A